MSGETAHQNNLPPAKDERRHQEDEIAMVNKYLHGSPVRVPMDELVKKLLKCRRVERTSKMLVRYHSDAIRDAIRRAGINGARRLFQAVVTESLGLDKVPIKRAKADQLDTFNSLVCFQCGYFLDKNAVWDIAKEQERPHLREPMKKELHFRTVPIDHQGTSKFCCVIEPEFCFVCHEEALLPHYNANLTKTPSETWDFSNLLSLWDFRGQATRIPHKERESLGIPEDRLLRRCDLPARLIED